MATTQTFPSRKTGFYIRGRRRCNHVIERLTSGGCEDLEPCEVCSQGMMGETSA